MEDGETVSIYESNLNITKRQNNPYLMKTVLMLDNSTSITEDTEHPNILALLNDAAKGFVDNMSAQQEIALYKFSSSSELILDFTSDKNALKVAIDNITSIKIAKKTRRIVWQNIIFAPSVKLLFIIFATFGLATMWEAVLAIWE